jgi:hypothetical protein
MDYRMMTVIRGGVDIDAWIYLTNIKRHIDMIHYVQESQHPYQTVNVPQFKNSTNRQWKVGDANSAQVDMMRGGMMRDGHNCKDIRMG